MPDRLEIHEAAICNSGKRTMVAKDTVLRMVNSLIDEAHQLLETKYDASRPNVRYSGGRPFRVELRQFAKWRAGCSNLLRTLGSQGEHWKDAFTYKRQDVATVEFMLGTLEAINAAIEEGFLIRVEELVTAEIFDDLLVQAEYLLSQDYFLAAGVLGRAVLEAHLRKWCDEEGCAPSRAKPTLADFNVELYKAKYLTKTDMKHVESMAAVGNDAAHNQADLRMDDVDRMIRDVRSFVSKHA